MLLAATLDDQETFDGLWAFTAAVLDSYGLPNWDLTTDGEVKFGRVFELYSRLGHLAACFH